VGMSRRLHSAALSLRGVAPDTEVGLPKAAIGASGQACQKRTFASPAPPLAFLRKSRGGDLGRPIGRERGLHAR